MPTTITLYDDHLSTTGLTIESSWTDLVRFLTDHVETPCATEDHPDGSGPLRCRGKQCQYKFFVATGSKNAWAPIEIEGRRADANVRSVSALVLDIDHLPPSRRAEVDARIAPYRHICHTSHSHRLDDQALRFIIALSRPVLANEYHAFYSTAVARLGVPADPTCKNRSRLYFVPSHPKGAPFEAFFRDGEVLDVDEILRYAVVSQQAESRSTRHTPVPESDWDLEGEAVESAIDLIDRFFPSGRRNELALALAGMLKRAGASRETARYVITESFRRGGSDKPDVRARAVDHTWDRDDDLEMTGFSRVSEILGTDEAKELGDYFTSAANDCFLSQFRPVPRPRQPSPDGDSGAISVDEDVEPPAAPPVPIDFKELRREVTKATAKRQKSEDRSDKVDAVLLRRLHKHEPLVPAPGVPDPETIREQDGESATARDAVRSTARLLAFYLPKGTPWDAVEQLFAPSLAVTQGTDLLGHARRSFEAAAKEREAGDYRAEAELRTQQEAYRASQEALSLAATSTALVLSGSPQPPSIPTPPGTPPDGPNWQNLLTKVANGITAQTENNVTLYLRNHPDFCGHLRFNEISKHITISGGPLRHVDGQPIEAICTAIQDLLVGTHALRIGYGDLVRRVMMVARQSTYDPLKEYLNSISWDGQERLTNWLERYCGAVVTEDNQSFIKKVSRRWLIALVARGLDPGCKMDNVLVLEGDGGIGKSSVFQILGGQWFSDTAVSLGDKDSRMLAAQYWICELAELVAFTPGSHKSLKAFFSSPIDKFRVPYGAGIEEFKRRCVFVGTTNDENYLYDETGNRKYWTVSCHFSSLALEQLKIDRDQLLAEAVVAYRAGEKWHFSYEEIGESEAEAEMRMIESPIDIKIRSWWYAMTTSERPRSMSTLDVWEAALEGRASDATSGDLSSIGHVMRKMKFKRARDGRGKRSWRYFATEELLHAERVTKRGALYAIDGGKDAKSK